MLNSGICFGAHSGITLESMKNAFGRFSLRASNAMGAPWAFVAATLTVIIWAVSGPVFAFSDTWQLVINTGTTVLTFLAVFLIQNTQNRDALAIHLKLDELLRGVEGARTGLVSLESLSDDELQKLDEEFHQLHEDEHRSEVRLGNRSSATGKNGRKPAAPPSRAARSR